jgi:hypothetical protein
MRNIFKRALKQVQISLIILFSIFGAVSCAQKATVSSEVAASSGGKTSLSGNGLTATEATLSIPAGALDQNVTISVTKLSVPPAQGDIVPVQAAYQFGPADLQFLKPATLDVCYNVQELVNAGLSENTVSLYYLDPVTGDYANIGGSVNTATHCVSAQVEHFSTYLPAASALAAVNTAPVVGAPTFLPATPIAGIPLNVRSVITSFQAGQTGAIATTFLKYRIAGSGAAFTSVAMRPDFTDATGQRYMAVIPAANVTLAGIEYYLEATDNLGKNKKRPATAPTAFTTRTITVSINTVTPLRLTPASANLDISAGFSRDFTP